MSCNGVASVTKFVFSQKHIFQPHLVFFRYRKVSRWLGYYSEKLFKPVFEERKRIYRETVMRAMEEMPTLEQRLNELNAPHPVYDMSVDIGLPASVYIKRTSPRDRLSWQKEMKSNRKIEKLALNKELQVDLDELHQDWMETSGPSHIERIAKHYKIFQHLFQNAHFTPCVRLGVAYDHDEDYVTPIHMGNVLEASEAAKCPHVTIGGKPEDLWTIVFTNLDGHLLDTNSEYLHWFVGNIKGNDISTGETICDYLQPFPMKGTGYHRLTFVLYKQEKTIDFSALRKTLPCLCLKERTFKTYDFYKEHQDVLTPAGLSFFQCIWDSSLTNFFHHVLNMREPVFEYKKKEYVPRAQVHHPHLQPFNLYLDQYRDPKDIKKEVLLKRLQMIHPFEEEKPMPKFPCLHKPTKLPPSWLADDLKHERLRIGKYQDLRPHSVYPREDHFTKMPHDLDQ